MPQLQEKIEFEGSVLKAVRSGNNAAWICLCGSLLVGHTCSEDKSESDEILCTCGKKFLVIGEGRRFSKAIKLIQTK